MVRETRHLWVGNLPENIREEDIVKHFTRYGRVESVKILPKRSAEGGRASFVDFVDIRSATKAHESPNRIGDRELRTDYNEPSSTGVSRVHEPAIPSPPRGRRYDRRTEGAPEGRYNERRPHYNYDGGYSDDDGGPNSRVDRGSTRYSAQRGPGYNRDRDVSHKRPLPKPDSYNEKVQSPDRSSEGGSDSSHSQSDSSSSSSSSDGESGSDSDSSTTSKTTKTTSALCVQNLSTRSSDGSIREGLYHEFKKHGEVTRIYIHGTGGSRSAIIYFRRPEEAERALEVCQGKMFLGAEMQIQHWHDEKFEGSDFPPRHRGGGSISNYSEDEFDPGCTRTLFVGNIEKTTTYGDLKEAFERYGEVIDVDIKKQPGNNPYAFVQFAELSSAIQARRKMDREYVGRNRVKVGFGKVNPINTIWVGGVTNSLSEQQVERHFGRYGRVTKVVINRVTNQALVSFDSVDSATIAHAQMKGRTMFSRRVRVEFVSRESRQLFYDTLQRMGHSEGGGGGRRYDYPPPDRPRGHSSGYYDNRRGNSRGMRGGPRRGQGYRPWHSRMEYNDNYSNNGLYPHESNPRHRDNYEGGPGHEYESDDFDQQLKEYNYRRQREREREREREGRHMDRGPRDRHEGDYTEGDRYYPEGGSRWSQGDRDRDRGPDRESSVGSYDDEREPRDHKPSQHQDYPEKPEHSIPKAENRERMPSVENKSELAEERKGKKKKEKKSKRPLQPGEGGSRGSDTEEEVVAKRRKKVKEEERVTQPDKTSELTESTKRPAADAPPPTPEPSLPTEKKKKEKREKKERKREKKTRRARTPVEEPENFEKDVPLPRVHEEQDQVEKEHRWTPDGTQEPYEKHRRPSFDDNEEECENGEDKARKVEVEKRLSREERDPSRSPWASHREERKRRHTPHEDSPPPPPPPPPPPEEPSNKSRVIDRTTVPMSRPPYDVVGPSPVRGDTPYDTSPLSRAPLGTSPIINTKPAVLPGLPGTPPITSPSSLPPPPPLQGYNPPPPTQQSNDDTLLELLCRYPVVWQGLVALKNDTAAVQMHYLSGNSRLAEASLPQAPAAQAMATVPPPLRIAQRMKLEQSQLEGVVRRMQCEADHCLLLALPCGRDPLDVHAQTRALKNGFINYLQQKQAAGIINVARPGSVQPSYVLHIFPPCDFAQEHLARVSPDLLDSAADSGHLMVVVASV
ncbi:msx2-interacting protein [Nematostella vectensis]|nr:msx2-interacting protein [Nematostella vectensis]